MPHRPDLREFVMVKNTISTNGLEQTTPVDAEPATSNEQV